VPRADGYKWQYILIVVFFCLVCFTIHAILFFDGDTLLEYLGHVYFPDHESSVKVMTGSESQHAT